MTSESVLSSRASIATSTESPLSHRFTFEFPERLKYEGADVEEDVTAHKSRTGKYMNQSFLSVIANAGSRANFNPHLAADTGYGQQSEYITRHSDKRTRHGRSTSDGLERSNKPSRGTGRVTTSQNVLRSTPGLSYASRKSPRRTSAHDHMAESQILPPIPPTPDPASAEASEAEVGKEASLEEEEEKQVERSEATLTSDTTTELPFQQEEELGLSERVAQVFGLRQGEQVDSDYPCWLLQDILLKGHMYITRKHICFYAYMPKSSNVVLKSGNLSKRGQNNPKYRAYWFVLKGDVLSYYLDQSEVYFPRGNIDLRSGVSAELAPSKDDASSSGFQVVTRHRTHYFKAESDTSAQEWVKQIRKVIFRSRNEGDSVKILLPFEQVLDVEENPVIDFADTVRVRVLDRDETFAIDEYFFSFFGYGQEALHVLRSSLEQKNATPRGSTERETVNDPAANLTNIDSSSSTIPDELIASTVFSNVDLTDEPESTPQNVDSAESKEPTSPLHSKLKAIELAEKGTIEPSSSFSKLQDLVKAGAYPLQKATGIAGALRSQSKRMGSLLASESLGYYEKVSGMWTGKKTHYDDSEALAASELTDDGEEKRTTANFGDRFREHFALPVTEKLQATYFCYLHRVVPVYGKMYVGTRKLCFRSLLPGSRTKMIMPLKDVENAVQEKGFRFGYSGLVIVVRGHEELFFEFRQPDARDDCTITLLKCSESAKYLLESRVFGDETAASQAARAEHDMLQRARLGSHSDRESSQLTKDLDPTGEEVSPVLFDDPSASVVGFKPPKSLRITCLTIGSRGDIQPYIALCKGLLEEGHQPRIATHPEFEPWIRFHDIDFAPVAGDPAEIMRLCVENDMFTLSFFREANSKFRGWIDQLLLSSWKACQNTDLLIESPSAMAGIHIAEALEIPYFRAFTMPWTRTRAYPHAFAVPNQKMGGNYNSFSYVMFDNVFWQTTAGQINRWRGKALGLPPTNLDKLQVNKVPFLYNFSPSVVIPPLDFSHWIRITGFWFLDEGDNYQPPEELEEFIRKAREDGKKVVYVGFGSIVVPNSKAMTKTVIDAVVKADVRCILSKGWSERLDTGEDVSVPEVALPDCIFQIKSAPHDWLFRQIDAAAHHGGAGTTGASLRAGIPTIVKPFFGDQYFFGSRVEDLGVGKCLRTLNTGVLARALWEVTNSERIIMKAKELGQQIQSENGVQTAIQSIYRDLEYAKSLIKRPEKTGKEESEESWTMVGDESEGEGDGRRYQDPVFQSSLLQRGFPAASGRSASSDDGHNNNDEDNE